MHLQLDELMKIYQKILYSNLQKIKFSIIDGLKLELIDCAHLIVPDLAFIEKNSFFNEGKEDLEDFEFNQDIDFDSDSEIRSPGWIRYQKKLK